MGTHFERQIERQSGGNKREWGFSISKENWLDIDKLKQKRQPSTANVHNGANTLVRASLIAFLVLTKFHIL